MYLYCIIYSLIYIIPLGTAKSLGSHAFIMTFKWLFLIIISPDSSDFLTNPKSGSVITKRWEKELKTTSGISGIRDSKSFFSYIRSVSWEEYACSTESDYSPTPASNLITLWSHHQTEQLPGWSFLGIISSTLAYFHFIESNY